MVINGVRFFGLPIYEDYAYVRGRSPNPTGIDLRPTVPRSRPMDPPTDMAFGPGANEWIWPFGPAQKRDIRPSQEDCQKPKTKIDFFLLLAFGSAIPGPTGCQNQKPKPKNQGFGFWQAPHCQNLRRFWLTKIYLPKLKIIKHLYVCTN